LSVGPHDRHRPQPGAPSRRGANARGGLWPADREVGGPRRLPRARARLERGPRPGAARRADAAPRVAARLDRELRAREALPSLFARLASEPGWDRLRLRDLPEGAPEWDLQELAEAQGYPCGV